MEKYIELIFYLRDIYFAHQPVPTIIKQKCNDVEVLVTSTSCGISTSKYKFFILKSPHKIDNAITIARADPFSISAANKFINEHLDKEDYKNFLTMPDDSLQSKQDIIEDICSFEFMQSTVSTKSVLDSLKMFFILNYKVLRMFEIQSSKALIPEEELATVIQILQENFNCIKLKS